MSRGYPSMTALLALLAVAGYQNRDKIAEWLNAAQRKAGALAQTPGGSAAGGLPGNLSGVLAGTSLGDLLSGGLRDLVNTFKQAGQSEVADSWVGHGPNKRIGHARVRTGGRAASAGNPVATDRPVSRRDSRQAVKKSS